MAMFVRSTGFFRLFTRQPAAKLLPIGYSSSSFLNDGESGGFSDPLTTPKLFISGLSRMTTDEKLREAFSPYGRLLEGKLLHAHLRPTLPPTVMIIFIIWRNFWGVAAKVIMDRVTGRSKGFGFVRYASVEEASSAREGMNAKFLDGWVIFVDPAKPREQGAGSRASKTTGWRG